MAIFGMTRRKHDLPITPGQCSRRKGGTERREAPGPEAVRHGWAGMAIDGSPAGDYHEGTARDEV
jgi:hypothetical protein